MIGKSCFQILKISFLILSTTQIFGHENTIELKLPSLNESDEAATLVGIRPFRSLGIRLEKQIVNGKTIIHNYGHGGSGVTLAWGSAGKAIEILQNENIEDNDKNVAILGQGIVGLSLAYRLLNLGYSVTLYGDKSGPETTASVAMGFIIPHKLVTPEQFMRRDQEILDESVAYFTQLAEQEENAPLKGLSWKTFYRVLGDNEITDSNSLAITFSGNNKKFRAEKKRVLMANTSIYLQEIQTKVKELGAKFVKYKFRSLDEITDLSENIVFNCLGLGAKTLFNDDSMYGIRGHVVRFKNNENIDYGLSFMSSRDSRIVVVPWNGNLHIGPTHEDSEEEIAINPEVEKTLREEFRKFFAD